MAFNDTLGDRIKEFYENIPRTRLMRRTPVIIRIDGKAFHTFTRGFQRPFDEVLMRTMHETTKYLCQNIQGCVLGYTQSDEISLLLIDYKKPDSLAWFDNEVQKMCSVAASMTTMIFNKYFGEFVRDAQQNMTDELTAKQFQAYEKAIWSGAMFDARVFNLPREEVTNYFYWRQLDAARNSVQMVARVYFSHKELVGVSNNLIQDKLFEERGVNWNDFPVSCKRGTCVVKDDKGVWMIDLEIPMFKAEDREYIEKLLLPEES